MTSLVRLFKKLPFAPIFGRRWSILDKPVHFGQIPQVYSPDFPLHPLTANASFKGRTDFFQQIRTLELADQPPVLLLSGQPRIGKTSVLNYLSARLSSTPVPLILNCSKLGIAPTLLEFAKDLSTQIIQAVRQFPRSLHFPSIDEAKLALDPFPALLDWLTEIERSFPGRRFLLCFDNFDCLGQLLELTGSKAPLNFLRHLCQHRAAWLLLFATSQYPKDLPDYWSDYLVNTSTFRLTYLDELSARELILSPVRDFPDIYDLSALDAIIDFTGCHPYLLQLTCAHLVEYFNSNNIHQGLRVPGTLKLTRQNVQTVSLTVLHQASLYFLELLNTLSSRQHHLLCRLVRGEVPTLQDQSLLRQLERREILKHVGSVYSFQVPLFQKYIQLVFQRTIPF
jgi:hypothetical protein